VWTVALPNERDLSGSTSTMPVHATSRTNSAGKNLCTNNDLDKCHVIMVWSVTCCNPAVEMATSAVLTRRRQQMTPGGDDKRLQVQL
jgi:hypothetical protein